MHIPGLGAVVEDSEEEWLRSSEPIPVPVLGRTCHVVLEGYEDDDAQEDFHAAIRSFLTIDRSVLEAAAPHIFAYYRDVQDDFGDVDDFRRSNASRDVHYRLSAAADLMERSTA